MNQATRAFLLFVCVVQFLLAVAFFIQWPPVMSLWPFPGTTPLTAIFLASIFAAAGASTLWAVAARQDAALAGISLDYVMILAPVAVYSVVLAVRTGSLPFFLYGVVCMIGALCGGGLLLWSARRRLDTTIPLPGLVRWSFVVFIVALLIVSGLLIFQVPNVLPWPVTLELSVVVGWMFFGAMTYFVYGLARPSWANAAGQLAGFLAYDLVLIVPFLTRLPTVAPQFRLGLWVYTAVVVYSAALAVYFLLVHPPTRIWQARRATDLAGSPTTGLG